MRHAAVLAEQLPVTARVNSPSELGGLSVSDALLTLIEFNTRVLWWKDTEDARRTFPDHEPKPLFDFSKGAGGYESMTTDEIRERLSRDRTEAV